MLALSEINAAVASTVRVIVLALECVILETFASLASLLLLLSVYRCGQIKAAYKREARRERQVALITAGAYVGVDVLALPLALLLCCTWKARFVRRRFGEWSYEQLAFEKDVFRLVAVVLHDALCMLCLLVPLLSWNHGKAREALRTCVSADLHVGGMVWGAPLGLLGRTFFELLLLLVGLPIVTVSWRCVSFYKGVRTAESFFALLIDTLINLALDLPFVIPYVITVLSWRSSAMRKAIAEAADDKAARGAVCKYFGKVLQDLTFVPLILILFACFWRAAACVEVLRSDRSWENKMGALLKQVGLIFVDIPCAAVAVCLLVTVVKAPALCKFIAECRSKGEASDWHAVVAHMGFDLVLELLTLPLLIIIACFVLPLFTLATYYQEMLATYVENNDYPYSHCYAAYRSAVVRTFGWLMRRIGVRLAQLTCVLLLLLPLVSWNHRKAMSTLREVCSERWDAGPYFSTTSSGLLLLTMGELLLYVTCLPIVLVSWRSYYFCKNMPSLDKDFAFDDHLLHTVGELLQDLPYALPLVFVVLSWRSIGVVQAIWKSESPSETRQVIGQNAVLVLQEWTFVPGLLVLTVCFWRASNGWKIARGDDGWATKWFNLTAEVILIVFDVLVVVCSLPLLVAFWRLPNTVKILKEDAPRQDQFVDVMGQLLLAIADLPCCLLCLPLVATIYRAPPVFKMLIAICEPKEHPWHLSVLAMYAGLLVELLMLPLAVAIVLSTAYISTLRDEYNKQLLRCRTEEETSPPSQWAYPLRVYYDAFPPAVWTTTGKLMVDSGHNLARTHTFLLLLVPFLSWNRSKAKAIWAGTAKEAGVEPNEPTALLMLTIMELLLYVTLLPIVTVTWRSYRFFTSLSDVHDPIQLDRRLLITFGHLCLDVPFIPFFLIAALSWRSGGMVKAMRVAESNVQMRWEMVRHAGFVCLDLLLVPPIAFLFVCFWRAHMAMDILVKHSDWTTRIGLMMQQVGKVFLDIPCFAMTVLLLCSLYRAPSTMKYLFHPGQCERSWHGVLWRMFTHLLLELILLPLLLVLLGTLLYVMRLHANFTNKLDKFREHHKVVQTDLYPNEMYFLAAHHAIWTTFCRATVDALLLIAAVLTLTIPFLSWNHYKARQLFRERKVWAALVLLVKTLLQLVLYAVAIPLLTFSWRVHGFYKALPVKTVDEFDEHLLGTLGTYLLDLPLIPSFLITFFSWRHEKMFADINAATSNSEMRGKIWHHSGMVLLEWMLVPMLLWLTVFCWRAVPAWRIATADISWFAKFEQLCCHALLVFVDLFCFALLLLNIGSLYRLAPAVKVIASWRDQGFTEKVSWWHSATVGMATAMFLDLLVLPLACAVHVSLIRIPTFYAAYAAFLAKREPDTDEWGQPVSYPFENYYTAYRVAALAASYQLLLDIPAICAAALCAIMPWRLVSLVKMLFCPLDTYMLLELADTLKDELALQQLFIYKMNSALDDLSAGILNRNASIWAATVKQMDSAWNQSIGQALMAQLQLFSNKITQIKPSEANEERCERAQKLCKNPTTQLEAVRTALFLLKTSDPWVVSDVYNYSELEWSQRPTYASRQKLRAHVFAVWGQFWARVHELMQPPPPVSLFSAPLDGAHMRMLCYQHLLYCIQDLLLLPPVLLLICSLYRLPTVATEIGALKSLRGARLVVRDHAGAVVADAGCLVIWALTLLMVLRSVDLISETYEAVILRRSASYWRGITWGCFNASLQDLGGFGRQLFSAKAAKYCAWVTLVTLMLPAVIAYHLICYGANDPSTVHVSPLKKFVAVTSTLFMYAAMFVLPWFYVLDAMPKAIHQEDSTATASEMAEDVSRTYLGLFFAALGCFVAYILWTYARADTLSKVYIPHALDGHILYVRSVWSNYISLGTLAVDAVQLATLVFVVSKIDLTQTLGSGLKNLGEIVYLNDFRWDSFDDLDGSRRRLVADTDPDSAYYGQNEGTMYFKFALLLLWVAVMTVPIVWDELSKQADDVTSISDRPLFRTLRALLGTTGFLTLVQFLLAFIACDYEENPPTLRAESSVECFTGTHAALALVAMLGLAFYLPTTLVYGALSKENKSATCDIVWTQLHALTTNIAKLLIAAAFMFSGVTTATCVIVAVICGLFILFTVFYGRLFDSAPCTLPEGTILRTCAFGFCMIAAIACYYAMPTVDKPTTAAAVLIAGWVIVAEIGIGAIAWTQYARRQRLHARNDPSVVRDCKEHMRNVAQSLPANVFTNRWHTVTKNVWFQQLECSRRFPDLVELLALLVTNLREEAFSAGAVQTRLKLAGVQFEGWSYLMMNKVEKLPGVWLWWPVRARFVQGASGLPALIQDMINSIDPAAVPDSLLIALDCEPDIEARITNLLELRASLEQRPDDATFAADDEPGSASGVGGVQLLALTTSKDQPIEEKEADEEVQANEKDDDEAGASETHDLPAPKDREESVSSSSDDDDEDKDGKDARGVDIAVLSSLFNTLPVQFLAAVTDLILAELLNQTLAQLRAALQPPELEIVESPATAVPLSTFVELPGQDIAVIHPAILYANPELMEQLKPEDVALSKRYLQLSLESRLGLSDAPEELEQLTPVPEGEGEEVDNASPYPDSSERSADDSDHVV